MSRAICEASIRSDRAVAEEFGALLFCPVLHCTMCVCEQVRTENLCVVYPGTTILHTVPYLPLCFSIPGVLAK